MHQTETPVSADETLPRMRGELKELLGRTQGAREVLAHLAAVERALKTVGLTALESLPTLVLKRAASQLESVLPQPCGPGITELRERLAKVLADLEQRTQAAAASSPPVAPAAPAAPAAVVQRAAFFNDASLQVSEATVTEFNRVVEASERRFS
jgi:hypothetical protein